MAVAVVPPPVLKALQPQGGSVLSRLHRCQSQQQPLRTSRAGVKVHAPALSSSLLSSASLISPFHRPPARIRSRVWASSGRPQAGSSAFFIRAARETPLGTGVGTGNTPSPHWPSSCLSECTGVGEKPNTPPPTPPSPSGTRRSALLLLLLSFPPSLNSNISDALANTPASAPSSHASSGAAGAEEQAEAEREIREAVRAVLTPAKCPGVLRLAFHDAGTFDAASATGGANGSIIFELDRRESEGLKRYVKLIGKAREQLEAQSRTVSWADAIAVGGAVAIEMCGGPHIQVPVGRQDSGQADAPGRMPAETFNADQVLSSFASKGFSVQETVVLLGGHTLGGKGFGNATEFDNSYFSILLQQPWNNPNDSMASMIGLPSDKAIAQSEQARSWIEMYARDGGRFFTDFAKAYVKMVNNGATWKA